MWMSGVGSRRADGSRISGKLGADLTVEQGYEAAQWCALNLLARMKVELGTWTVSLVFSRLLGW